MESYGNKTEILETEYSFYKTTIINSFCNTYTEHLNIMGLDLSENLYNQPCYFDKEISWGSFFDDFTWDVLKQNKMLLLDANESFFEYDGSDEYIEFQKQLLAEARKSGNTEESIYKKLYGENATKELIKKYFIEYKTSLAYEKYIRENIQIKEDDIQKYAELHKEEYFYAVYDSIYIEEDKDIVSKTIQDEESFYNLANTFDIKTDNRVKYKENDEISEWLFTCQKYGEIKYFKKYNLLVLFKGLYQDNSESVSIRHILISNKKHDNPLQLVSDIKVQFEKEGSEEYFIELAKEYSEDVGTASIGGLISNMSEGIYPYFDDWCFDSIREEGDTSIIESPYGYHIVFFKSVDETKWHLNIRTKLLEEKFNEYMSELSKNITFNEIT